MAKNKNLKKVEDDSTEDVMVKEAGEQRPNQKEAPDAPGTPEDSKKGHVLLGTISYQSLEDYEKFLNNLDINQSLFVLISGCGFAQSRGAYSLEESELISRAIKTIKKTSDSSQPAKDIAKEDKE